MASTSSAAPAAGRHPVRVARRLRAPSWRDARLIGGIALVLLATVLGSALVARARATTPVLVLTRTIPAGQAIEADDLRVGEVRLGDLAGHYLSASARPGDGAVAARDLHAGDLLPADAVASGAQVARRRIVLPVESALASTLVRGSRVEVWVSARTTKSGVESVAAPRQVLTGAVVADPRVTTRALAGGDSASVALWVPTDAVPALLAAVDQRSTVALVPQPGSPVQDPS